MEPGKRPRVTLTPTLAMKDGLPWMAFSVQGGDSQDQNLLQYLLNVVEFGMNVQQAVEAERANLSNLVDRLADVKANSLASVEVSEDTVERAEEAVALSPTVAAERQGGRLYFFNASGLIYSCPEEDGERVRLGALRMLSAAVTNQEKEVRHELSDDEVRAVAAKEVKKRTESIEAFDGAGRHELADREREERDTIAAYAPEMMSADELAALIDEALAETGASSEKELGRVMGVVMGRARGRADGNEVRAMVRARLQPAE